MKNSRQDIFTAFILSVVAFGLYAGYLSQAYVFEGLIRAMPIETGRWVHLLPGNYLLYGPLGLVFHTLLRLWDSQILAVTSLQWMDALLGAAGIFVFYLTLRKLGGDRFAAGVWSSVLAFSLGYWFWSTDAEDYILSTVLLLMNFYFLVKAAQGERVDPVLLGALHGLAILGHIVNVIFGAVVLWVLFSLHGKKGLRLALHYAAATLLVAGGAYAMVLGFVRHPSSLGEALRWFAGSAGVGTGPIDFGGPWTLAKFGDWLTMSLHIWGSFSPAYQSPPSWSISPLLILASWFLLGIFGIAFCLRFDAIYQRHRAVVGGCLLWLGIYACVFTRWQPWTMVYRVSDLVPLCILLFLGYQSIPANRRIWQTAAALLGVCLMMGNLGAEIRPRSYASNNAHLERMTFLKAHTEEADWITGDGGHDEIYIPYFAQRRPIVVDRYIQQPVLLIRQLEVLAAHNQRIFVTSRILERPEWQTFFKNYALMPIAQDRNGFALFRLGRYHGKNE